jgi:DNA-binding PadR family transcriptional regulator
LFYIVILMGGTDLGGLELAVIKAVITLADDAYGLSIRREVSSLRRHDYSVGAIYTTLGRLEEKGLIRSWVRGPLQVRGGRSRRQYQVTGKGKQALRDAGRLAARLWDTQLGLDPA